MWHIENLYSEKVWRPSSSIYSRKNRGQQHKDKCQGVIKMKQILGWAGQKTT